MLFCCLRPGHSVRSDKHLIGDVRGMGKTSERYFFHISDDMVEIRDKVGVYLPVGEDLESFCKNLFLAVALEDGNEFDGLPSVIVADEKGNEIFAFRMSDLGSSSSGRTSASVVRVDLH